MAMGLQQTSIHILKFFEYSPPPNQSLGNSRVLYNIKYTKTKYSTKTNVSETVISSKRLSGDSSLQGKQISKI